MGADFSLPFASPDVQAAFAKLPADLVVRVVRTLLRDEPAAVGHLVCSSRAWRPLLMNTELSEAAELRCARALLTEQRLAELKGGPAPKLIRSISHELISLPQPVLVLNLAGRGGGAALGRKAARLVRVSGSLASLYIGSTRIGNEGAAAIAEALKVNGSLATLDISGNRIGNEGAKAIADALAASGSLTELGLTTNNIGHKGATAIAEALLVNGSLATLDIRYNDIGDEGAKALAAGVAASGSLTMLNLGGNKIGDEGAKALAACVAASGSLADLRLFPVDKIGDPGAKAIADAVAASGSLALKRLFVGYPVNQHWAELMAACESKSVKLL